MHELIRTQVIVSPVMCPSNRPRMDANRLGQIEQGARVALRGNDARLLHELRHCDRMGHPFLSEYLLPSGRLSPHSLPLQSLPFAKLGNTLQGTLQVTLSPPRMDRMDADTRTE